MNRLLSRLERIERKLQWAACSCPRIAVVMGAEAERAAQARIDSCPADHSGPDAPLVVRLLRFSDPDDLALADRQWSSALAPGEPMEPLE